MNLRLRCFGGWAEFADKTNRLSATNQRLKEVQSMQAALCAEHSKLTATSAYIRRGMI